jgi:hypothetical protein
VGLISGVFGSGYFSVVINKDGKKQKKTYERRKNAIKLLVNSVHCKVDCTQFVSLYLFVFFLLIKVREYGDWNLCEPNKLLVHV